MRSNDALTPNTQIQVSHKAASKTGTSSKLESGDTLTINDLLHGLMLPSGNDSAYALAESFGHFLDPSSPNPV